MALSIGNATAQFRGNHNSITLSHNNDKGNLLVAFHTNNSAGGCAGATWDGGALSNLFAPTGEYRRVTFYLLIGAKQGTYNIVGSWPSAGDIVTCALSIGGIKGQMGSQEGSSTGTNKTHYHVTLGSCTTGNLVVSMGGTNINQIQSASETGQVRATYNHGSGITNNSGALCYETVDNANMCHGLRCATGANAWLIGMIELQATAGAHRGYIIGCEINKWKNLLRNLKRGTLTARELKTLKQGWRRELALA